MADHDIQKSRHLLKHLEKEMMFLNSIVSQIESLSHQAQFVTSGIRPGVRRSAIWRNLSKTHI